MGNPFANGKVKSRTGNAQLNESDVRMIRRLAGTQSVRELAEIYCVGMETVRKVIRRDSWKWLAEEIDFDAPASPPTDAERLAADASFQRLQKLLAREPVEAPGHAKLAQLLTNEREKVVVVDQHLNALRRSPLDE